MRSVFGTFFVIEVAIDRKQILLTNKFFFNSKMGNMKRILFLLMVAFTCLQANATLSTTDFSTNNYITEWGRLKLVGNQLSSENGQAVQLKGWSSFGWQSNWGDCHSDGALDQMKAWGANVYRGAMYVAEGGYNNNASGYTELTKHFIDYTAKIGMYYLCDWHILTPGDPLDGTYSQYNTYFNEITNYVKSKGYKHVLYEICNEPNGVSWARIKEYAGKVLPTIQSNDPGAVVVVGTPQWDQNIGDAVNSPITGYSNLNIMYAFHFYSCSHYQFLSALDNASKSIPVFISEWGIAKFDGGDGTREVDATCISNADALLRTAKTNQGGQIISWCAWSFGEKNEQASSVMSCGTMTPSITGTEVIRLMGGDPKPLPQTACYANTCQAIPGIIDLGMYDVNTEAAEDAIGAGEGVTYHEENTVSDEDNARSKCNGAYKWAGEDYIFRINECVDASGCYGLSNTEGWHNLGYIEPNEWTVYTLNIEEPGYYSISALCNPTTKQNFSITSVSKCCNLLVNLDTKEEVADMSFATSMAGQFSGEEWKHWAWEKPVEDVGDGAEDESNTGILFKEAGKHTIKISFLAGLPDDGYPSAGDLGPLKFEKVAGYTGAGYVGCATVSSPSVASDNAIAIYPNPNNGTFSVSLNGEESAMLTMTNYMGQVVYSSVISADADVNTGLQTGNYFATITTAKGVAVVKVAIK